MVPDLLERDNIRKEVELCVHAHFPNAKVYMFGSSSFMLFEENSDIDICFQPPLSPVSDPLRTVYESAKYLFPGLEHQTEPTIPFLRYFHHLCIAELVLNPN
jgi:hypothetical protein